MITKNKNLFLFILLLFAIAMTYWFEERSNDQALQGEAKKTEILSSEHLGLLKGVKGIKIDFEKKGEEFYSRNNQIPLAKQRLEEFFKILGGLKVKMFLQNADVAKVGRSFYIPDDLMKLNFQFEKGAIEFVLGKKLDFDQNFYMEITQDGKKQIVIVHDESPDPGIYQTDKEYQTSDAKYKRLQMIFLLTNVYFYDTKIFKDSYHYIDQEQDDKKINFDQISIATFRNKKFTLSLKNTATIPSPPKGISYLEDNWLSFHKTLTNLSGKTIIFPYEPLALSKLMSQFEIINREGRPCTLTLYQTFGEQHGHFLTSSLDHYLYVLKPEDAHYFFVNVQDFWKKNIFPKSKEYQLSITFYDNKMESVKVIDRELFKVEAQQIGVKVRPLEFKKLIDFLKTEGDHVSELTEKPSEIQKKNIMKLRFDNRMMSVILEDNDAILIDDELKIKIHHYVGATLPFSIKRSDYFE